MTRSSEHHDADFDRERDATTHQVVYLVRRPDYELVFSIPTTRVAYLSGEQARFLGRFRGRHQEQEFVLSLEELEDFYESLSRLMEYIRSEHQGPHTDQLRPEPGSSLTHE
jgi:hypothetical protein